MRQHLAFSLKALCPQLETFRREPPLDWRVPPRPAFPLVPRASQPRSLLGPPTSLYLCHSLVFFGPPPPVYLAPKFSSGSGVLLSRFLPAILYLRPISFKSATERRFHFTVFPRACTADLPFRLRSGSVLRRSFGPEPIHQLASRSLSVLPSPPAARRPISSPPFDFWSSFPPPLPPPRPVLVSQQLDRNSPLRTSRQLELDAFQDLSGCASSHTPCPGAPCEKDAPSCRSKVLPRPRPRPQSGCLLFLNTTWLLFSDIF